MAATATRTDPALWETVKRRITDGDKGGNPGQWSARKAQLAVQEYRKAGGGYAGAKRPDNSLKRWTAEDWGTKSGARSKDSGERYLPRRARERLSEAEYARTTAKKRADTAKGKQVSAQPSDVAAKTAAARQPAASRGAKAKKPEAPRVPKAAKAAQRPASAKAKPKAPATPPGKTAASAGRKRLGPLAGRPTTRQAAAKRSAAKAPKR